MTKKKKQGDYNYDYRYPNNWLEISREAIKNYPICSLCHTKPSKETHHMYYRLNRGHGELLLDKGKNFGDIITLKRYNTYIMTLPT